MRLYAIKVQVAKELDQFRRDRLTVALAFVLPVAALLMYGLATRLEATNIPVAVSNCDYGKSSRELVDRIYATVQFVPQRASSELLQPLDRSEARAVVTIPPDFSRNIAAGRPATFQVVVDGSDVNNARVVKNAMLFTARDYELRQGLSLRKPLVRPVTRLWYNPGRKESLYIVPGAMALILWVFPALLSTIAMAREKEQGTILQVYASNLTAFEFMSGKALAYLIVAFGEFLCLTLVGMIVFGLRLKAEPITFLVCTFLYLGAGVLFGLAAGTRANTQMAAVQIVANVGFLGAMLLSGFIYPLRNIVYPLSLVSYMVPTMYYVLIARNEFVRGGNWLSLWYAPLFLLGFDLLLLRAVSRMKMKLSG